MQDMVPRGDRSIRNIPITHSRRTAPPPPPKHEAMMEEEPQETLPPIRPRRKKRSKGFWFWAFIVVVVCAAAGLLLSTVFAGATVTVYPKEQAVTAPATVQTALNAPVGTLSFETMSASRSATTTVAASGTKQVSRQASGVATIYNAYDTNTQRLIANTRFEAPDGKIYRIRESVTVPGATKKADGSLTPGSVSATLYADSPGDSYNRAGSTNFTIPGFKNDPRYTKFSASAPSMSGGYVGPEPAVAAADLAKARTQLEQSLDQELRALAQSSIPEGYVTIPGTLTITFGDLLQTAGSGNTASLSLTATARANIVRQNDLATAIARATIEGYSGESVTIADMSALTFAIASSSKPSDSQATLTMSGSPTIRWNFDPNALEQALIGKDKNTFQQVVSSFAPAIGRANASIRPFWSSTFPTEPERIHIVTGK